MKGLARWWRSPWVRYGITFLLLALIFWKVVDPEKLWTTVQHLSPVNLIGAMALTIPFLMLKALRWHLLLRAARCRASFGEAFVSLVGGMGVALLTPARVGEITRAVYLSEPRKLRVAGLVMVDKAYDVIVLALLSAAGAALLVSPVLALGLGLFGVAGVYLALRPRDLRTFYALVGRRLPLYAKIDKVLAGFAEFRAGVGALCLLYTLGSFAIVLLQYWIILRAWEPVGMDVVTFCFPLVVLTNVVPLTVAGLGTREEAAILLLKHYHIAASIALTSAFLMFFMNTALPGLIGFAVAPFFRKTTPEEPLMHESAQQYAPARLGSGR
jgi:uncharacterized membrane protein YbhN (UPF0104 family)